MTKEPGIFIKNPTTALKLLRHFGFMLKNLSINFHIFNVMVCAEIEFYLAKYCSKSLIRLTICCHSSKMLFENLYKPLENITALTIYIHHYHKDLQFNCKYLPRLKYIYINNYTANIQKWENFDFKNIEYFTIATHYMNEYPFSFGKLKHLTFRTLHIDEEWCKFISNIQNLTTLKMWDVSMIYPIDFRKMLELQNILSNIEELQIEVCINMSPEDVLHFLEQSQNLKTLTLLNDLWGIGGHYFDERIKKKENILKTITSNLSPIWKCYIFDGIFPNPFYNGTYNCYVIKRITE